MSDEEKQIPTFQIPTEGVVVLRSGQQISVDQARCMTELASNVFPPGVKVLVCPPGWEIVGVGELSRPTFARSIRVGSSDPTSPGSCTACGERWDGATLPWVCGCGRASARPSTTESLRAEPRRTWWRRLFD